MNKEIFLNENRPHESGIKHVSGGAYYTDDIPEPPETLYGAIGWSKKAHAIIKKINFDEVIKSEGVVAIVTAIVIAVALWTGRRWKIDQHHK